MGQRITTSIQEGERADHTRGCLSLLQYKQQNKNYGRRVTGRAWSVLTQLHGSEWRVIGYSSRRLSDVERRYSNTEKEALALVWACERFNMYVSGREFELETDHKPLEYIYSHKSKPSSVWKDVSFAY